MIFLIFQSFRMLEPLDREEITEYKQHVERLVTKIPSEFEKFMGNPDFEALGPVLAMQVLLEEKQPWFLVETEKKI